MEPPKIVLSTLQIQFFLRNHGSAFELFSNILYLNASCNFEINPDRVIKQAKFSCWWLLHAHWSLLYESRRSYAVPVGTPFTLCSVRPHGLFKFKFTAWAVRSSTYVLFTPLRIFWEPTPSFMHRRHFVRFASLLSVGVARRSLWSTF
jgi:hypothetical protein